MISPTQSNTISVSSPFFAEIPSLLDETAQPTITTTGASMEKSVHTEPPENNQNLQQPQAPGETQRTLDTGPIYQPVVRIEIPAVPTASPETTDGYFKLRPWQLRCSAELTGYRNFIVNAPTAAGKCFVICTMATERMSRDADLKVIIAVPQAVIAAGFRHNKIEMPDGTRVHWEVSPKHDLCGENARHRTARLLKFLTGPTSTNAMDRVVLCTHATLMRAFSKNAAAFKDILIIIDEAHHIQYGITEDQQYGVYNLNPA